MIKVDELTKRFPNGRGIFDLSLEVADGEVLGFIGPNGAGKSTTIRHLLGFIKPDSGHSTIGGYDAWTQPVLAKKDLGYLPGEIEFPKGILADQFLTMMCSIRGVKNPESAWRPYAERLNLDVSIPIARMSKGNKQKVAISSAFATNPKTIILDEPSTGLDPLMQDVLIELFVEAKNRGCTILLSSHIFEEVEAVADRITIVRHGRIVANETMPDVRKALKKSVSVTFDTPVDPSEFNNLECTAIAPNEISFKLKKEEDIKGILDSVSGKNVIKLVTKEESLREYFRESYREDKNNE